MSSLPATSPRLKSRSQDDGVCRRCNGLGQSPGGSGYDPAPCDDCAATGRVVYAERRRRTLTTYLVTAGANVVDVGQCPLERLAAQLVIDWPELAGDLAVWSVTDELCAEPRLVAMLRPDRAGKPAVTWL